MEDEKKSLARKFYESDKTEKEIAEKLAVSIGLISKWCSDLVDKKNDEQERLIVELYLQCLSDEEIASKVGITARQINNIRNKFKNEKISKLDLSPSKLQVYDVWNYSSLPKDQLSYPGAIPSEKDIVCTTFALRVF